MYAYPCGPSDACHYWLIPPPCQRSALLTHSPLPSEEVTTQFLFRSLSESQGQNLALTFFHVPYSLDSGLWGEECMACDRGWC